jgi:hypothetical protein
MLHELGPFPCSLPPNPACTFQCTGLSSDLCRVRDGVRVDPGMAVGADNKGLAPHLRHEGGPRGLARPGLAEVLEHGDLVDGHCGAVLAQLAPPLAEPLGQFLAGIAVPGRGGVMDDGAPVLPRGIPPKCATRSFLPWRCRLAS